MSAKARKRVKHVREEDITNPVQNGGMCSLPKSTATIVAEAKQRDMAPGVDVPTFTEGENNVEETINGKPDTIEPDGTGTDTKDDGEGSEVGSQGTRVLVEKTKEQERREEFNKNHIHNINKGAKDILSCLEPQFAQDFYGACRDYKCENIGVYILGILNRLSKQADYYDIDFEPEWERGDVGHVDKLFCQYCNKEIVKPTRMKQKYCCNLCSKYDMEKNETGLIFPEDTVEGVTIEDQEAESKLEELKRTG